MLKTVSIVAVIAAASIALPAAAFAQMENGMDSGSMGKSSMSGMKSKSSMMKKKKMSHGMHRGMMKKPMSGGM